MIIGFDGSDAILRNHTTQGNYSKIVIDAISKHYPKNKLFIYTPRIDGNNATSLSRQGNVSIKQPKRVLFKRLWMPLGGVVKNMNRHHLDIYHGLSGTLPLRLGRSRSASVVTVHDLAFLKFPEDYSSWTVRRKSFWTRHSCMAARRIIATSQHTKDELMAAYGISPEKIDVIYPAVDSRFLGEKLGAELDSVRDKYKLPRRYILVVSSLLKHKNVLVVLKAMSKMHNSDYSLVIVGETTKHYGELQAYAREHHLMSRLVHIKRAHTVDMPSIFMQASAFVAASRLEGFGMTLLEAQSCLVPVIVSRGTGLDEAAGEGALYFDPDNSAELAQCLDDVLTDGALRDRLVEAGKRNAERFDSKRLADALIDLYHDVLHVNKTVRT